MIRMGIAQFRRKISEIKEPVEILKGLETIGYFYPGGLPSAQLDTGEWSTFDRIRGQDRPEATPDVAIEPGSAPRSTSTPKFRSSQPYQAFNPVPKSGKTK